MAEITVIVVRVAEWSSQDKAGQWLMWTRTTMLRHIHIRHTRVVRRLPVPVIDRQSWMVGARTTLMAARIAVVERRVDASARCFVGVDAVIVAVPRMTSTMHP